jgi:hypothetical protein
MALIAVPPAAITPTTANCDAPENKSSESKQAWRTEKSAATAAAPKALPYAPTVIETLKESRFTDTPKVCPNPLG